MVFTPKPATFDPLGKFPAEPVYHGDFARKSSDHAKTGDLRSAIWEKYFEICLVWRFSHEKAALTPKSTFRDRRLGKDIAEPVYHGDRQEPRDRIGKPMRNGEDIRIGKIKRGALVVAAIDDKRPQILVSPFQGVKALRIPDYSPFFSDRLLAS